VPTELLASEQESVKVVEELSSEEEETVEKTTEVSHLLRLYRPRLMVSSRFAEIRVRVRLGSGVRVRYLVRVTIRVSANRD